MSERAYGKRYNEAKSVKEVAALVRAEIKAAIKSGELPKLKASVRYKTFSGGCSIDVNLSELGIPIYNPARLLADRDDPHTFVPGLNWMSDEAGAVVKKVEAMLASYNHDGSDSMTDYFDVRFYGHVDIDDRNRDAEVAALPPKGSPEANALRYGKPAPKADAAPSNVVSLDAWVMEKAVKAAAANGIYPILDSTVEGCAAAMWHDRGAPCALCAK